MIRPTALPDAVEIVGEYRAGGTDFHSRRRVGRTDGQPVDLRSLDGLAGISSVDGGLRVGALTRVSDLATDRRVVDGYPALAATAGAIATPQIRAVATVGGNLLQRNRCPYYRHPAFSCFKSGGDSCPAREGDHSHGVIFDLGPCIAPHPSSLAMALMLYQPAIELSDGRRITVEELLGDGSDGRRDHQLDEEVLVAVHLPPARPEVAAYRRVTARVQAEWPIVEAACRLEVEGGVITGAAVAVGGVAPVPLRRPAVEAALTGVAFDDAPAREVAADRVVEGAAALPMTSHKLRLLPRLVLEVVEMALDGDTGSEVAFGERGLGS